VYGPLTSTSVTTIIREENCASQREGTPEKQTAPISSIQREEGGDERSASRTVSRRGRVSSSTSPTPTRDELRELRQTRSLFLCGRGLLSLRHIQHLSEMLSLRFLSVHMNAIKTLEAGCLRTLRHLVELDLSANELQELPQGCWAGLDRLERLNLSTNLLTRLGPGVFGGLPSLQWLSLGFNDLHDITGLSSVPAVAPLSYVDLCANRVATVAEVLHALTPHRAHLQELRLASPSSGAALPNTSAEVNTTTTLDDSAASNLSCCCWRVQENPLCCTNNGDSSYNHSSANTHTHAAAVALSSGPAPPPVYVQQLLAFFPHLLVVNGVSYGVDPLELLTAHPVDGPANREGVTAPSADHADTRNSATAPVEASPEKAMGVDTSEDFARLLSQPLPHLPDSTSSMSSSSSSHHFSSQGMPQHHRQHHTRSTRSRNGSHGHSHPRTRAASGANVERTERRAPTQTNVKADTMAPVHSSARRRSALKPRRAPLRHRRSASASTSTSTSPLSHDSVATASPPVVLQQCRQPQELSRAAEETLFHVRQLRFDSEDGRREGHEEGNSERSEHLSAPRTAQGRQRRLGSVPGDTTGVKVAAATASRSVKQSMPGLSSSDLTDTSHRSPSLSQSVQEAPQPAAAPAENEAWAVEMSGSSGSDRSPDPLRISTDHLRAGVLPVVGDAEEDGEETAAARATERLSARRTLHTIQHAAAPATPSSSPYPVVSSTSLTALQWKPKQVSRGTLTDPAEGAGPPLVCAVTDDAVAAAVAAAVERVQNEMHADVKQLQEQLALRTTTIADMRHHLDLTRSQHVAALRESQQQQQLLRSQVAALKDEMARRGEEATILQRKQQAQLNRAVDSVKAEWSRRLQACEEHHAAFEAEERARWEANVLRLQEEVKQLQQTCTVKMAQLTTMERQANVMEAEMAELRRRAVVQRQQVAAQASLLVAEGDGRRDVEVAAANARVDCARSFFQRALQGEREVLCEALQQLQETTQAAEEQQMTHAAQVAAYEAALQHAMSEAQQLREQPSSAALQTEPNLQQLESAAMESSSTTSLLEVKLASVHDSDAVQADAYVSTPTPTPATTPELPPCTALVVVSSTKPTEMSATASDGRDASDSVSAYWRNVFSRTEMQLRRVEEALRVSTTTQRSLASENTRLLHRVADLEAEQATTKKAYAAMERVAAQEKENLLRTLHTLRDDMEKKEGALDALEEEARAKLHEKRQRIAELEEAVETLTAQRAKATEMSVSYRTECEAAQRSVAELQRKLEEERSCRAAAVQQQAAQVPEMELRLRELSELLATRNAQAHQHELEKKALVHALTTAREQLVRLQESNTFLSGTNAEVKEQLMRQQAELDAARQQLRDVQEATRAKQRATREALSHLMTADAL
jgi:Leucine-rich repeat (LRR) protein